jgi:hypothetical protein
MRAQAILKLADGRLQRVAAPWLISAEGAHSLVRTTLDVPFEGHTRDEQYVLGDLLVAGNLPNSDFHIFSRLERDDGRRSCEGVGASLAGAARRAVRRATAGDDAVGALSHEASPGVVPDGRRALPPHGLQSAQPTIKGCRAFTGRVAEDL